MDAPERILVAMSGGVDSAVAAALLLDQGHACSGVNLRMFSGEEDEDAHAAARSLGMPFHVFDFTRAFEEHVIQSFVEGYARGETPNPCVDCNRFIKFAALQARAIQLGYDAIATGHYARRERDDVNGRWLLRKGADAAKDQSYVLAFLTQQQLAYARFPLGELCKSEVRAIAAAKNLCNAQKRESQDICFVPGGDYGAFLERRGLALRPGDFVDPEGNVLGRHRGTARYTLGQRKGLGLALERPGYVCAIRPEENTVVVGEEALLYTRELWARGLNWIAIDPPEAPLRCKAKARYRQAEQWATAERVGEDALRLRFDEPQRAITPGQTAALYDGEYVLGAGVIQGTGG